MPILSENLQAVDACDMICPTRGAVTLTDEIYSSLASLKGFVTPNPPKRTGSASMSLSNWLTALIISVMARMRTRDIALSSGSSRSWMRQGSQEVGPSMF